MENVLENWGLKLYTESFLIRKKNKNKKYKMRLYIHSQSGDKADVD